MASAQDLPQVFFSELCGIIDSLHSQLEWNTGDLDYIHRRIEELLHILSRFTENSVIPNGQAVLENLVGALQILQCSQTVSINGYRPPVILTGQNGRPAFDISKEQLEYFLDFDFTVPEISRLLDVSVRTIRRRMSDFGLSTGQTYTDITNLRSIISGYLATTPNSGYRIVYGFLRSSGIRVSQLRVRETLRALDPIASAIRGLQVLLIPRRPYSVPSPLSLWHIDGNHKLVRWRIIIHGGIDGYSRKIMYMQANTDNKATTVFQCFMTAVNTLDCHRAMATKVEKM
ncbi:hypothetical protein AALO_G00309840 [Alosa alosa]|uniref:Integrase core domain-containing protein n=1 Tax=Alosa alosa TaxID=278164 RepID=A0AAV6FCV0_9TELE|nr:hypothetical protein AALO_G00309840 [Alosa alosa]